MPDEDKAQGLLAAVVRELEPRARQLRKEIRELEAERRTTSESLARLRAEVGVRQEAVEGQKRQAREAHDELMRLLRDARADIEAEIARRRQEIDAVREQLRAAEVELHQRRGELEALTARAESLRRDVAAAEQELRRLAAARQDAEASTALAGKLAAAEDERLAGLRRQADEVQELRDEMAQEAERLRQEIAALKAAHRPLRPYAPPENRPRIALEEQQVNAKLQAHDARALRLYAQEAGIEMRAVVTEALRNYLPHAAYDEALRQLIEEHHQAAQPAAGGQLKRVPPEGAGVVEPSEQL